VWIPFALGTDKSDEVPQSESVWPDIPAATILFVDDDDAVRVLASRLLAKGGHRVLIAANAGEALLIAESHGPVIELLVTDTVMPYMDGPSLVRRMRGMLPAIGVILISGHSPRGQGSEGQDPFLAKPFSETQLARIVSQVLENVRKTARA
jgi:two-component system cell cycle sensor histidine kinase/response regulator CckA